MFHDICVEPKPKLGNCCGFFRLRFWNGNRSVIVGLQIKEGEAVREGPVPKVLGVVGVFPESVPNVGEVSQQLHGVPILGCVAYVLRRILEVDQFVVVTDVDDFPVKPLVHVFCCGTAIEGICLLTSLDFDDCQRFILTESS